MLTLSLQTTRFKPSSLPKSMAKTSPAGGKSVNWDTVSLAKMKPNGLWKTKDKKKPIR